jgi:hypothetical protein
MALITAANARLYAAKSAIARQNNRNSELRRLAEADELRTRLVQTAVLTDVQAPTPVDEFIQRRLLRVRAQLERLDDLLADEDDSKTIKELSEALSRLQDQEQKLSGRPGPGTLRPMPERKAKDDSRASAIPRPPDVPAQPTQAKPQPSITPLPAGGQSLTERPDFE